MRFLLCLQDSKLCPSRCKAPSIRPTRSGVAPQICACTDAAPHVHPRVCNCSGSLVTAHRPHARPLAAAPLVCANPLVAAHRAPACPLTAASRIHALPLLVVDHILALSTAAFHRCILTLTTRCPAHLPSWRSVRLPRQV